MARKRIYYWKLIKSALMLVFLFGTYNLLHCIWPWINGGIFKIIFLFIMRLVGSLQVSI